MSNTASNAGPIVNLRKPTLIDPPSYSGAFNESGPNHLGVGPADDINKSIVQPGHVLSIAPTELLGRIQLHPGKRGYGGYSDVFSGEWTSPNGEKFAVAVKVLRDLTEDGAIRNKKRLKREGAIWQMAQHRNIVKFYGVLTEGDLALVSEWCSKGNLLAYLKLHPEISFLEKLKLLKQAGDGLVYLHHELIHPIFHGDIKPENVLVKDNGEAAFCDLGVSRVAHAMGWNTGLTSSNPSGKGSKGYQAPEVLDPDTTKQRDGEPSSAADVYAFGSLILAVLSGRNPFESLNISSTILKVVSGRHPEPTDHPTLPATSSWWSFLYKCWSLKPEDRPNMKQVVEELQRAIDSELASSSD